MIKKYGKVSKSVLIIVIVAIVVICLGAVAFFGISAVNKEKQEKVLSDEITSMYTSQKINSQIKATGNFAIVEKAVKDYYTEFINANKDLIDVYSQNLLNNSLTANNISSDGPDFNKTKESIKKIKDIENTTIEKLEKLSSDEYIKEKKEALNLNKYYSDLFESEIKNNLKIKEEVQNLKDLIKEYDGWIGKIEDILNFLTDNKSSWKVSGNNVMFTSDELVTKYNTLLSSLLTQETVLKSKLNTLKQ